MRESLRQAGQRFMVGFEGHEPFGRRAGPDPRATASGHVILFARNVDAPEQVAELVRELQAVARDAGHDLPLMVAVDQEGGRVARLRAPWTVWPSLRALGRLGSEEHARRMGAALAAELRACGIRWDFAPVVDVDTNPKNPVIGDRSFGARPRTRGPAGRRPDRGPARGRSRRLRQALPRPRRHRPRLAPRAARGDPSAPRASRTWSCRPSAAPSRRESSSIMTRTRPLAGAGREAARRRSRRESSRRCSARS